MPKMPSVADGGKYREAVLGVSAYDAIYLRQMPFYLWADKQGCLNGPPPDYLMARRPHRSVSDSTLVYGGEGHDRLVSRNDRDKFG